MTPTMMPMPDTITTGWDLGGAHLKVAQIDGAGRLRTAQQLPCTLWRGLEHLAEALAAARRQQLPSRRRQRFRQMLEAAPQGAGQLLRCPQPAGPVDLRNLEMRAAEVPAGGDRPSRRPLRGLLRVRRFSGSHHPANLMLRSARRARLEAHTAIVQLWSLFVVPAKAGTH